MVQLKVGWATNGEGMQWASIVGQTFGVNQLGILFLLLGNGNGQRWASLNWATVSVSKVGQQEGR